MRTKQRAGPDARVNGHPVVSTDTSRQAECNLVAALVYCPRLIDELQVDPAAISDEAARDLLILARFVYGQHGEDRPIGIWELTAASDSIPERPLDRHEGSTLAATLLHGELLTGQVSSNWKIVRQAWRRREYVDRLAHLTRPGVNVDEAIPELRRLCDDLEAGDHQDGLHTLTSAELDAADFQHEELIRDVLVARQPCVIGGPPKCCKTLLTIDLALSLGSGASFLGHFRTMRPTRVAVFSGESGGATIQESARRIARAKPWFNLADYTNVMWSFDLPTLDRPNAMAELRRYIQRNAVEVLIVDPLYLAMPIGDDNKNVFAMGAHLRPLSDMAAELGVTLVLAHHFTKAKSVTESPATLADLSGAGFAEWARQWILVSRRTPYDLDRIGHHELWLGTGGSAGHGAGVAVDIDEGSLRDPGGRRWQVAVETIGQAVASAIDEQQAERDRRKQERDEADISRAVEDITKALASNPDGLTLRNIRESYGVSGQRLVKAIERLEQDGVVERGDITGANRRTYEGIRLRQGGNG
jgi:DNA-binding MarR family transcriptional regulator